MFKIIHAWLVYTWGGLHRYFGNANSMMREHELAAHYFARAYEIDPTFRSARLQRAVLLGRELGRHEEALNEFNDLLTNDPSYGEALLNRGITLQEIGRYHEALSDLEGYLQLPDNNDYDSEANRLVVHLRDILKDLPS